nr:uncharacterized protein LOC116769679 [Danaus plexippus plexippus]
MVDLNAKVGTENGKIQDTWVHTGWEATTITGTDSWSSDNDLTIAGTLFIHADYSSVNAEWNPIKMPYTETRSVVLGYKRYTREDWMSQRTWNLIEERRKSHLQILATSDKAGLKGDLSECANWRGITLLSTPSKLLCKIILDRLSRAIETLLRKEQDGCRPNRSPRTGIRIGNRDGATNKYAKSQEMRCGATTSLPLLIGTEAVEKFHNYTCLESIVSETAGTEEDKASRIAKSRAAFAQLRHVWQSRKLIRRVRLKIFRSNVKTELLYRCETWKGTKDLSHRLQVFVNWCLHRIYWLEKISNVNLWECCGEIPIDLQMKRCKWKWIGHTLQRDPENIPRQALDWIRFEAKM